jgi:hypothetical protein
MVKGFLKTLLPVFLNFYDLNVVLIERYSGVTTRTEILLFGQHFARIEDDSTESITLFYHLDHLAVPYQIAINFFAKLTVYRFALNLHGFPQ